MTLAALGAVGAAAAQGLMSGPYELPYKNTYVKEVFVAENEFRNATPERIEPRSFDEARRILPAPFWEGHEREVEMYWHAWRIAVGNIRQPAEGSGFVSPYLDIAYNGNIFMWDASFMMMFARYGYRFFPFQRTLDNFYAKQHPDGFICREIRADGSDCFERYDPTSTGPDLLPWVELAYYRHYGDLDRLHRVFPALCAYARWWKLNRTWPNGTYWSSGWGTGMDNMPRVREEYNPIYSNGHMEWLDTNLQQMLVNESLLQIGFYIERWQEIEEVEDENRFLRRHINECMWDDKEGFLFDRQADGSLGTPLEAATSQYTYWYWPGHGFQRGNTLYLFMTKFYQGGEGQWGFRFGGTDFVRIDMRDYSVKSIEEIYDINCPIHWGHCVLKQGDWYYVYGTRSGAGYDPAQLCVSRAKFDETTDGLGAYEYFDGKGWSSDPAAAAACEGLDVSVSEQFSVFAYDGRYVLLTQRRAQQAGDIYSYVADTPVGPWYNKKLLYATTEQIEDPELFTYNAMAHPQFINDRGELLFCYNINSYNLQKPYLDVSTYRPVFLRVPMSVILE